MSEAGPNKGGWRGPSGPWRWLGLLCLLALLVLWQRTQMYRLGYEIEAMKRQKDDALRVHQQLLVEVESLSAVERIERIALDRLHMIPALPQQRVYIKGATH